MLSFPHVDCADVLHEVILGRRGEAANVANVVGHVGMDLQVGEVGGGVIALFPFSHFPMALLAFELSCKIPRASLDVTGKYSMLWRGKVTLATFVNSRWILV